MIQSGQESKKGTDILYVPDWMGQFSRDTAGEIVMSQNPGEYISRLRDKYRITQREISELSGLSRETISRIENGKKLPSIESVRALTNLFTLIEAARVQCTHKDLQIPFFKRLCKEFGFSVQAADEVLKIAMEGYSKKREELRRRMEE